jgi:hypothetical protein
VWVWVSRWAFFAISNIQGEKADFNAKTTMTIYGNATGADVAAVDGTDWYSVLEQPIYDADRGATYGIRFRARADAPRRMRLTAVVDPGDSHWVGLDERESLTGKRQD